MWESRGGLSREWWGSGVGDLRVVMTTALLVDISDSVESAIRIVGVIR